MISLYDYIIQNSDNSAENKAIFDIIFKISDGVIEISKLLYGPDSKDLFGKQRTKDIVRARNIIHNILNEKYVLCKLPCRYL